MNRISYKIEEDYSKVGFSTVDDFTVKVWGLRQNDAEWLRGQILHLIKSRDNGCLP